MGKQGRAPQADRTFLTSFVRPPTLFFVLAILASAVSVLALAGYVHNRSGVPATAVVVAQPDGGLSSIRVEGASPGSVWEVSTSALGGAKVGDRVPVRLRGACSCRPFPVRDFDGLWAFVATAAVLDVWIVPRWWRARRGRRIQQRALAAVVPGSLEVPIRATPHFTGSTPVRTQLWLALDRSDTGQRLGWVGLRAVRPGFDPRRIDVLIGEPVVGAPVAVAVQAGAAIALPVTPLLAQAQPAAPWSAGACSMLGWDAALTEAPPVVGASSRVSVGDLAGPGRVPPELAAARVEVLRRGRSPRAYALSVGTVVLGSLVLVVPSVTFAARAMLCLPILFGGAYLITYWANRPLREAVVALDPTLAPWANVAGRIVGGLLPRLAPAPA